MEGKVNFFLIGIIAFLSAAVAFIVIYLVMTGGTPKAASGSTAEKSTTAKKAEIDYKKAAEYAVPEMTLNLKPEADNPKAIIRVDVTITLADSKFAEEFKKREAEVQDIIRSAFNGKTASQVYADKIDVMKDDLLKRFKAMYTDPKESNKILKVWIPSSIVQ